MLEKQLQIRIECAGGYAIDVAEKSHSRVRGEIALSPWEGVHILDSPARGRIARDGMVATTDQLVI